MKHLLKGVILMALLASFTVTMGACKKGDDGVGNSSESSVESPLNSSSDIESEISSEVSSEIESEISSEVSSEISSEPEAEKPVAPVIAMDATHKITWEAVAEAEYYVVSVNGVEGEAQEELFFQGDEEIGEYAIKVKAVNEVGASEYSNEILYAYLGVTAPTAEGIVFNGAAKVEKGKDYSFNVALNEGYEGTLVVNANGTTLTAVDGAYTVENVQEALTITVEGAQLQSFDVICTGENITFNGNENVNYGDDYEFSFTLADGYVGAIVYIGETVINPDESGNYIVENVKADVEIKVVAYTLEQKFYLASNWTSGGTFESTLENMTVTGAWRLMLNATYINEVIAAGYDVLEFDVSVGGNCAFLQDDRGFFLDLDSNKTAHVTLNLTQDMTYTVRGKTVFGTAYDKDIDAANHTVSNVRLSKAELTEIEESFYATGADKAFTVSGTAVVEQNFGGLYVKDTWQATLNATYVDALIAEGYKYLEFDLAVGSGAFAIQDSYNYYYEQNENGWVHIGLRLNAGESFVFRGKASTSSGGYSENSTAFAFIVKNVTASETSDMFDMTDSLTHFNGASYYCNLNRAYVKGAWRVVIKNDDYIQDLIDAGYKTISFKVKAVNMGTSDSFDATKLTFANVTPVGVETAAALDENGCVVLTYNLADMIGKDTQFRAASETSGSGAHNYWISNMVLGK